MKIAYMLRDPLDLALLFVYVIGVLVLIFAAMQLLHTVLYKEPKARKDGLRALLLSLVLLAPRIVYHRIRLDASDYTKAVQTSIQELPGTRLDATSGAALLSVQPADTEEESTDILVISAPLYRADGTENIEGLSVLTAVSRQTEKMKRPLELRYLAFTGEAEALQGARQYLSSLSEEERSRIVGDLQLGDIGRAEATAYTLGVSNGRENPLTDRLVKSVKRITGQKATLTADTSSDHTAFSMEGIASVLLEQRDEEQDEKESGAARSERETQKGGSESEESLDEGQLADAAAIVGDSVQQILREKTGAFRAAIEQIPTDARGAGAFQPHASVFPSGEGQAVIEQQLGTKLTDTGKVDAEGQALYKASLYLLQQDQPIPVYVHAAKGASAHVTAISVDTAALGLDRSVLQQTLTNFFGEAKAESEEGTQRYLDSEAQAMYDVSATIDDASEDLCGGGYALTIRPADPS